MTAPDQPRDPVATAQALMRAMENLGGKVADLAGRVHKDRRLIVGLAVSLILDLALTVVVAVFAVQAHDANTSAQAAKAVAVVAQQNNRNLCLSGNESRGQQHGLWLYLISLSPPKTAQSRKLIGEFEQHLTKVFMPRDCNHVNPGKP